VTEVPGRLVLLGHPVAHSLSPVFQNAALEAAGIRLTYDAVDVPPATLTATLDQLARVSAAGNVTVPHKLAVARACVRLTAEAERVGAVNTFAIRDGVLVGHNTDIAGFTQAARDLL
jgi:shikimate dehydrogenase